MNTALFATGNRLIVIGLMLLALGQLAEAIMPALGRAAFQAAAAGTYTPGDYALDLSLYYIIALGSLIGGIILSVFTYLRRDRS
jgi:hypothetical protein